MPVHAGELYLELHRGTLTNRHEIKRNNRKGEVALHDLEGLTVLDAIERDVPADDTALELHRGTLTNRHEIKRNNRKGEVALHDLEGLTVLDAIERDVPADDTAVRPLMETLLKNQFHDILPGSSISRVHEESIAEMHRLPRCTA